MSDAGKGQAPGRGQISPADREAFRKRASSLGRRLQKARPGHSDGEGNGGNGDDNHATAMGRALRLSTELIGGIIVGSAIGWGLDQWLGTWPAFFIVFFLLGSAAGMFNVVRSALHIKTGPIDPSKGPSVPDDDDEDR